VLINWCYKGIAESADFDDAMAERVVMETGLMSKWITAHSGLSLASVQGPQQTALSAFALDDHVNDYYAVKDFTPYISLGAGCMEYQGPGVPPVPFPALATAAEFATTWGTTSGYVFSLWVVTSPQEASDLPGLAEEVRNLRLFSHFHYYHHEGEIAAKLYVPRRQVECVFKVDALGNPIAASWTGGGSVLDNPEFVGPNAISNVIAAL
jgi:hypothetical protein